MLFSILCSGFKRSASTWSYNVCRELMQRSLGGRPDISIVASYVNDTDGFLVKLGRQARDQERKVVAVLKAHEVGHRTAERIAKGRIRNVFTIRDPRDSLASMERFWPRSGDLWVHTGDQSLEERLRVFQHLLIQAERFMTDDHSHVVRYEKMIEAPEEHIAAIAHYIGLRPDKATVAAVHRATNAEAMREIAERTEAEKGLGPGALDPETNIHSRHIDSGAPGRWRDELDADTAHRATIAFLPWLISLGYADEALRNDVAKFSS